MTEFFGILPMIKCTYISLAGTLPQTDIAPARRTSQKEITPSNQPFSGAMLVSLAGKSAQRNGVQPECVFFWFWTSS